MVRVSYRRTPTNVNLTARTDNNDFDTASDMDTSMSSGSVTDADETRRTTRIRGQKRNNNLGGAGQWRNSVLAILAKSKEFVGDSIIKSDDVIAISAELTSKNNFRTEQQIQQVVRDLRHHIKKSNEAPKFVKTEAEKEAFDTVARKLGKREVDVGQKKKVGDQKKRSMPASSVQRSRAADSDGLESLTKKVDNVAKKVDKIAEDLAVFRKEVLQALSQRDEHKRIVKSVEFVEGDESEVDDKLQSLLQLKNSTVTSTVTSNEYTLENFMGSGSFAVVFRAVEKSQKKAVAMKITTCDDQARRERKIMRLLASGGKGKEYCCLPSETFDILHDGKIAYCFTMELLMKDLFITNFIEHKKFSMHSIVQIMAQIFSALSFINSLGYIHSDVKPENIMVLDYQLQKIGDKEVIFEPRVKLIDANCVVRIGIHAQGFCDFQGARLRSPEVWLGFDPKENIDSWAMGITAVELLKGDFVFDFYDVDSPAEAAPLVQMIEKVFGPLPERLWNDCRFDDLKNAREVSSDTYHTATLNDILDEFVSDGYGMIVRLLLPSILSTDPENRLMPADVAKRLTEFLPIS